MGRIVGLTFKAQKQKKANKEPENQGKANKEPDDQTSGNINEEKQEETERQE